MGYLGLTDGGILWEIEHNGTWRCELSDQTKNLYLSLAGPFEESGWHITLIPGESYTTPAVSISLGDDFDRAFTSLTAFRRLIKGRNAAMDRQPVFHNDYMLGLRARPTDETVREMARAVKAEGAEYYIMDAGWYADDSWWDSVGEWRESKVRFPNGLASVFAYIRELGLKPGIWLEPEVMGINCPLAKEWEDECFWMRYGKRVINRQRYQLDYRHPRVLAHMNATVDRLIREYGIEFFKFDYNIDAGMGTEVDAESVGDGFELSAAAFGEWIDSLRERYPEVIFENCASGSMRMNYDLLSKFHLQSTSDNENFLQTAVIASNAAVSVLPEQAGVWVCPLPTMNESELVYTIVNGFAGIPYFGGRPHELGDRFHLLTEAIEVYKSIRGDVKNFVPFWPLGLNSYADKRHCTAYRCGEKTYVILWQEEDAGDITLPLCAAKCECIYPKQNDYTVTTGDTVKINLGGGLAAGVFVME